MACRDFEVTGLAAAQYNLKMELTCIDMGLASYAAAMQLQEELLDKVISQPDSCAYILLVEHDPAVITIGKGGDAANVLASPDRLGEEGIEVHRTGRGGDVTYHGPGQLVAYPIISIAGRAGKVTQYIHDLEEVMIRLLERFGITASRRSKARGAWVGSDKIGAIGVAVKKWVAYHGLALNVTPNLAHFQLILPCGITDGGVTTLERELQKTITVEEIKSPLVESFMEVFGFKSVNWMEDRKTPNHLPPWLKKRLRHDSRADEVRVILDELKLETVCLGAQCPNQSECFARGTATFMILGAVCTRTCRFCAIPTGELSSPREDEPQTVAEAAAKMGLSHVVITSVTRDDLPDGGAGHFAKTIRAVRSRLPRASIEVLTPDFQGQPRAIETVLQAGPDVFNHNIEMVPRLYPVARPQADYQRSLEVLQFASRFAPTKSPKPRVKSGIMVGLGETSTEMSQVMRDLRDAGCEILTIGQYLSPSKDHLPVVR